MRTLLARCCSCHVRAGILFAIAIALTLSAVTTVLAQHGNSTSVDEEHRLTRIETRIDRIILDIEEIRLHAYLELLGLGGLVAEAGHRVVSGRKKAG